MEKHRCDNNRDDDRDNDKPEQRSERFERFESKFESRRGRRDNMVNSDDEDLGDVLSKVDLSPLSMLISYMRSALKIAMLCIFPFGLGPC